MNLASFFAMRGTPAKTVFGVARTGLQIQHVASRFKSCGFDQGQLSFVFRQAEGGAISPDSVHRRTGGRTGARSAPDWEEWMHSLEFFAMPGLGLLLVSGPLLAVLDKTKAGGIGSMFKSIGVSESVAARYTEEIRAGNILICFHSNDPLEAKIVKMILADAGASNVAVNGDVVLMDLRPAATRHEFS